MPVARHQTVRSPVPRNGSPPRRSVSGTFLSAGDDKLGMRGEPAFSPCGDTSTAAFEAIAAVRDVLPGFLTSAVELRGSRGSKAPVYRLTDARYGAQLAAGTVSLGATLGADVLFDGCDLHKSLKSFLEACLR